MSDVVIRPAMPADLPDLRLAMVELQEHERRLDATTRLPGEQIADAYVARLQQEVAEKHGAIFIAERNGVFAGFAVGWIEYRRLPGRDDMPGPAHQVRNSSAAR